MEEKNRRLSIRGLLAATICLLIYFCGALTLGLIQHAEIDLPGLRLSWGTASAELKDQLARAEAQLTSERSSKTALSEQLDSMSTGLNRAQKDLNSTDSTLGYYKSRTAELGSALEKAQAQIEKLKDNRKILERIAGLSDNIRQNEGVLQSKLAALKEASLSYSQLKTACEKGELTDSKLCSKTTERQNIMAALKVEVEGLQKEAEENRTLYRSMAKKIEDI